MQIKRLVVTSAVPLKDYKKVAPKSVIKNYRAMYATMFGPKALRLAFKLHSAYDVGSEFELPYSISEYLKTIYYTVNPDNPRQAMFHRASKYAEITKILSKQKDVLAHELLILFNKENQKFLKDDSIPVWCVISRYARDYLGQAYDKSWDSCKNFKDGVNKNFLRQELQSGYLCAYFIRSTDDLKALVRQEGRSIEKRILALIDKSLGRLLVVPYRFGPAVAGVPDANTILIPASLTYGFVPVSAKTELKKYLDQNLNEKIYKVEKAVKVFVAPGYSDSNPVKNYYGATKDNLHLSDRDEIFEMVGADHEKINLIEDPVLKRELLKKYPEAIQYIKKPDTDLQMIAVHAQEGVLIRLIKNPCEEAQLSSVSANGRNLKFLRNASDDVKLLAIHQNGFAIKYIDNPTAEMLTEALTQNGNALQFIAHPTPAQVKLAKRTSGSYVTTLKKVAVPCFKDAYGEDEPQAQDVIEDEENPDFDAAAEDAFWNKELEGLPKVNRGGNH